MARFVFKLAPLHRVKRQVEDLAKDKLSLELSELRRRNAALELCVAEADAAVDAFRREAGGHFTVYGIRCRNAHISTSRRRVEVSGERAREAEEAAEAARLELVCASMERKMFDKLHGSELERYMADERRQEQRAVDEIVSYKVGVALTASNDEHGERLATRDE